MVFVNFPKAFKVDEIVDDADIVVDVEVFVSLLFQVFRNSRHSIRFVDGEGDHRGKGVVVATSVMSVPCKVVNDRHTCPSESRIFCHISYRSVGMA